MPDDVKPGGELFIRQMQTAKPIAATLGPGCESRLAARYFRTSRPNAATLRRPGFIHSVLPRCAKRPLVLRIRWAGLWHGNLCFLVAWILRSVLWSARNSLTSRNFLKPDFTRRFPCSGAERVGLAGVDVCVPEDYVPPLIAQFNRQPGAAFQIGSLDPSEFADMVARRGKLPVVTNDLTLSFRHL